MTANKKFFRNVQIFSELPDSELEVFLDIVIERNYKKDEVIFHADEPGSALFVLKSGAVKISISDKTGKEDILKIIYPSDFFGEMSLLDGQHRSATVTALEKSSALIIKRDHFISFIKEHPQAALNMLVVMSRRLRKTDEKIAVLRFADAYGKVARVLLDIADESGVRGDKGISVDLNFSRQELADIAGISRETMSRTLAEFQTNGCINIGGRKLIILNEAVLRRELL